MLLCCWSGHNMTEYLENNSQLFLLYFSFYRRKFGRNLNCLLVNSGSLKFYRNKQVVGMLTNFVLPWWE